MFEHDNSAFELLARARIARLATVDRSGKPTIVPVCFAFDGKVIYTPIDRKPKSKPPLELARVRNILRNPEIALIVDRYYEDWKRLWHILVHGCASLLEVQQDEERRLAIRLLRGKYRQYTVTLLPDEAAVIRITDLKIKVWGVEIVKPGLQE